MEKINRVSGFSTQAPSLAVPDAESARRVVTHWLRTTVGDALYPTEAKFVEESFSWDVPVWFSTAAEPMRALIADIYVNAATGAFLGRPTREKLIERLRHITAQAE
ncbi:MAG: hypothetical protein HY646_13155 [Acidobacteria bacterium]|nr:hypothetical protein [Acidobacteriota bacterium]